jgi:exodeoxyribonuclease VII small subunit
MAKSRTAPLDFEKAMAELEALVASLERGDLPLEESLKAFERGVSLTRQCQQALAAAEQKVEMLLGKGEAGSLVPFAGPDSAPDSDPDLSEED